MWGFTRRSCWVNGEPYTSRGVRTVRGRASGNPSPPGDLGAGCLAYYEKGCKVDDETFNAQSYPEPLSRAVELRDPAATQALTVIIARRLNPIAPGERYCSPQQAAEVMGVSECLLYHEIYTRQKRN